MKKLDYAIIFVSDMKRSVAFYRDVLGFPLKFESPDWTEFATEGTTLALHPAGRTPAGNCNTGFAVEDLDAFHQEMQAKNVTCVQPPRVEDFGTRLASYADPDGLPFSVAEIPKK
jgi:lactoylglutathione lyase